MTRAARDINSAPREVRALKLSSIAVCVPDWMLLTQILLLEKRAIGRV